MSPLDTLWVGPKFLAMRPADKADPANKDAPETTALRVSPTGHITALYAATDTLPDLPRVELPGVFATAGLIDAHLHLTWLGRVDDQLDLSDSTSAHDVAQRIARFAKAHPYLTVINGFGWDQTRWERGTDTPLPHMADLPEVGVPIVLSRVDGHALWLDRLALAAVSDLLTVETPGFRVVRDFSGPTGVLVDPPAPIRTRLQPTANAKDLERHIRRGLDKARAAGLVEVHDMATTVLELETMAALPHPLPVRVVVYLDDSEASFAWLAAHPHGPHQVTPDVWVAGIKLFADGALGSRGAALKADYSDEAGHRGQLADPAILTRHAVRAAELGYPVAIHAIGDRANEVALEIIETASRTSKRPLVARIEHAQVLDPADLDRFRASKAVASMQPIHAVSDMRWAEQRLGTRIAGAYAWRTIQRLGIPLAFGSDAPVEPVDPCLGLHAATLRGGWRVDEALPPEEAFAAFTRGSVEAAPLVIPGRTGRLEVGARAELTLYDHDPRTTPWPDVRVVGTRR